jgi:tetratricopeptide (TPR) repeat protein
MDMRHPADYAYHNCEFHSTAALIGQTGAIYEDLAALHVKSLCELDLAESAITQCDRYLESYPDSGELHYLLGMAKYLAGRDITHIESSFLTSTELGYAGGPVGLAFIEFARGHHDNAIALAASQSPDQPEMAHIRCLISFQLYLAKGDVAAAETWLQKADRVLKQHPSLMRQYWGQLCWVRLLRAKGLFESATLVVDRIIDQLNPEVTPRLFRNAKEARRMIDAHSCALNIIVPPDTGGPEQESLPPEITSRPMLLAFYEHLQKCGTRGASKEDLAQRVWEESYNPTIHDTRIYKTVARLRKLLGDSQKNPTRIVQVGRQYVLLNHHHDERGARRPITQGEER